MDSSRHYLPLYTILSILILFAITLLGIALPSLTKLTRTIVLPEVAGVTTEAPTISADYYRVTQVVDGDTVKVDILGVVTTIRFLGIDTPELHDPRKPVECYAQEAQDFLIQILQNQPVRLESDQSQGDQDRYGRLLRYIWLSDGTLVNKKLIEEGYAFEYTYSKPYLYQADFKQAQLRAQAAKKGLWSLQTCNGQRAIP